MSAPLCHHVLSAQPTAALTARSARSMSGYATLLFLLATPFLALWSDWAVGNSSRLERGLTGAGLVLAGVGAFARVQYVVLSPSRLHLLRRPWTDEDCGGRRTSKLGLKRS